MTRYTFPTESAATAELAADGWTQRESGFWAKRSRVDPAFGGFETTALVTVERRRVDPQYGADYFEIKFH